MRRLLGWVLENWPDMATLALILVGILLAMLPGTVARVEARRSWRFGISFILIFVGVTGFWLGLQQKHDFQSQIRMLTSAASIEATKTDIQDMLSHMDNGFVHVVDAVNGLKKGNAIRPPASAATPSQPPVVQHLRFSERRVASDKPESPYALQVVIQTDIEVEKPRLELDFTDQIDGGNFFVAGQAMMIMKRWEESVEHNALRLSFDFPKWTPDSPIVVTVWSKREVHVAGLKNTQF